MHNNGIRLLPGPAQPPQILMMMKRITASPIDEFYIGIVIGRAIISERRARRFQHIGNPRHRDKTVDLVASLWQIGNRHIAQEIITNGIGRRITKAKTTTGQTDLAKHRRKHNASPKWLFTMRLTGQ